MSWTGRFAVAGLLLVFFFALGLGPLLGPLLYTLTPLQREYLPAYMASSWYENDPADTTEIRWMLKLAVRKPEPAPGPKDKHDHGPKTATKAAPKPDLAFAGERDLVAKPVTGRVWAGDALPFTLSEEAVREGWTGLTWGYPRQVKSSELAPLLREEYFDGRRWERFFLGPAVALVSLFFLVLIGRAGVQAWRDRQLWGMTLTRQDYLWRWMFQPPKPQVIQAPEKLLKEPERGAPLTLAAPVAAPPVRHLQATPETAPAASAPSPKPARVSPPVVPGEPKPAYRWDESAGID